MVPADPNETQPINGLLHTEVSEVHKRYILSGTEVSDIYKKIADQNVLALGNGVAIGSSTADQILRAQQRSIESGIPLNFDTLRLNVGDLDFVFSGDKADEYIENVGASRDLWASPLQAIKPSTNEDRLKHYPLTEFQKGEVYYKDAEDEQKQVPVEIFSYFKYGKIDQQGNHDQSEKPYTARFMTSKFVTVEDEQGRKIRVLGADARAIQSWVYGREHKNDYGRAKEMINIYLSNPDNDLFTLIESSNQMCPYVAVDFAKFVFEYIEEQQWQGQVLQKYFGAKSAQAYELTKRMTHLFNPEDFPYHNFLDHIITSTRIAKELAKSNLISADYQDAFMLAVYAHESGLNLVEGRAGHENRGSEIVSEENDRESKIAAALIRITRFAKDPETGRFKPAMFVDENMSNAVQELFALGVSERDAQELLYSIGLVDIANICSRGQIYQSSNVLKEDFLLDNLSKPQEAKAVSSLDPLAYVKGKGSFYVGLFEDIRRDISTRILHDEVFQTVFYPFFVNINKIDQTELEGARMNNIQYIEVELASLLQEKIELWRYICADEQTLKTLQEEYLNAMLAVHDPAEKADLNTKFNRYVTNLYARMFLARYGIAAVDGEKTSSDKEI